MDDNDASYGSSAFDPHAPEFLPGGSQDSSSDISLGSSYGGSRDGRERGNSLVFGNSGSADFLSKYERRPAERSDRDRDRPQGQGPGQGGSSEPYRPSLRRRSSSGAGGGSTDTLGSMSSSRLGGAPPDRVNVHLNSLLVHAKTVDKILQVVEAHFSHFNAVNLITALHRLATVVLAARKGALRRDARFKSLIHRLSDTLSNADAGELKPQDLSNVAWALTKLGLLNAGLFSSLADHIMRTIEHFQPVNLSMTLWAFARSGFLDEKLVRASAAEVKRQLPDFQPQQIANTTWAIAKSGVVDEELFSAAAAIALKKLREFQPMNYSMLVYSFALARHPHPKLFEEVGKRCTPQALMPVPSAPHVITNLALAYSEAGIPHAGVFDAVAQVARNTLREFRAQQITTLVQAFARAGAKHDRFFSAVTNAVVQRKAEFKQQELQDLLTAYDMLGIPTTDIRRVVESQQRTADPVTYGAAETDYRSLFIAISFVLAVTLVAWLMKSS